MNTYRLHNPELTLRAPEPEDIDIMLAYENDEELWDTGSTTAPYSRYQLKKYISESQNDLYADLQLRLLIETLSKQVAGIIDLFQFDPRHRRAEVGIVIHPSFRRQGLARMALQLLEAHCFQRLGIHQLYAYIRKDNTASIQLFQSCGYKVCGELQEWLYTGKGYKDVCIMQKMNTFTPIEGISSSESRNGK